MLDQAIESLKTYDWGTDQSTLAPIDDAIAASTGNRAARKDIEQKLIKAIDSDISRDAKDYVCRKLAIVGSSNSVTLLSKLLKMESHSHMARYALERIPGHEATQALTDALSSVADSLKVGVMSSIGSRRDPAAIEALKASLASSNALVAKAAAAALGQIGTAEAASVLEKASPTPAVFDARLTCAESLLANTRVADAKKIYQSLSADELPRLVRLAATRGMLACAATQS
jgi:HEAT repeat protein